MATGSEGETTARAEDEESTAKEETASQGNEEETSDAAPEGSQKEEGSQEEGSQEEEGSEEEGSGEEEQGVASGRSIARAIDDVSSLPGETVNDQDGRKIGEVKEIYGVGEDERPMWVTIESATGLGRTRQVFVPLARIKNQNDEIRVPYSFDHIHESPEIEAEDEISEEDDRALRSYYAIGLADQELVESARSYASQVPDGEGSAHKIEGDAAEGPARDLDDTPPAKRVAEAYEKQKEEEGEEHRKGKDTTADEIFEEDSAEGKEDGEAAGKDDGKDEKDERDEDGED